MYILCVMKTGENINFIDCHEIYFVNYETHYMKESLWWNYN